MKTKILVRIAAVIGLLVTFSLLTSCQSKEEKVISQLESLCKAVEKDSFDIKDVDSVHLTDFEDTQLYIADGFDQMMRNVYGDYMKLPPENERVPQQDYIHFYWKE